MYNEDVMFYKLILQAFIVLGVSVTYIFEYFTRVTILVLIFCRREEENGLLSREGIGVEVNGLITTLMM